MQKNNCAVEIVKDDLGRSIVKINSIIFWGKQHIDWKAVEVYLQKYIGEVVEVSEERIWIEKDFSDEYTGSDYTKKLRGGMAKAKANAAQGIIEMLKIAVLKSNMINKKKSIGKMPNMVGNIIKQDLPFRSTEKKQKRCHIMYIQLL